MLERAIARAKAWLMARIEDRRATHVGGPDAADRVAVGAAIEFQVGQAIGSAIAGSF